MLPPRPTTDHVTSSQMCRAGSSWYRPDLQQIMLLLAKCAGLVSSCYRPDQQYTYTYTVYPKEKALSSVSDPYSSNPDPAKNLNPDPDPERP